MREKFFLIYEEKCRWVFALVIAGIFRASKISYAEGDVWLS